MKRLVVAIVGRPNVGKSTLFNAIAGKKISIIEDMPGVTRDRIYSLASHNEKKFHLIDTGGLEISKELFNNEIKIQVELAIDEADIVLFVVDGKEGLTKDDYLVKDYLIKSGKEVLVVINKSDSKFFRDNQYDFYQLGFEEYFAVSAEQKNGLFELQNRITKNIRETEEEESDILKFSIIGRPNVGKSSLVNSIVNEDRVIVSKESGTTRDAIDTNFTYFGEEMTIIDTAGMRKKGKIYESVERYSLIRTLRAIDRSNVCVLVINAEEGIIEHDKHIAGYAIEAGKALVITVNKWDLIEDKDKQMKEFNKLIRNEFAFVPYAPIVFLSALTKKRIHTLLPEVKRVSENAKKEIKTSILNEIIREAVFLNQPPSYKGRRLKIYFCNQESTQPPTFSFQVNSKGLIHFSYYRYLENKLRESFDLEGTPIVLKFKNKGEKVD